MKYIKKPIEVEAIEFTGVNKLDVIEFTNGKAKVVPMSMTLHSAMIIPTLEGDHRADVGDFIIKGGMGEFYPCKPDIFEMTYDLA